MNNQSQPKRNRLRSTLLTGLLVVAGSAYMLNQAADSPGDKNPKLSLVVNNTPINREGTHITSFAHVVKRVAPKRRERVHHLVSQTNRPTPDAPAQ